mmetsp:Transcript_3702/g.7035  ORF Transcript_3702/g.7035 Transcript_3702/m.7035 type:complete len:273 (+) Transcript_3702:168-986(+)
MAPASASGNNLTLGSRPGRRLGCVAGDGLFVEGALLEHEALLHDQVPDLLQRQLVLLEPKVEDRVRRRFVRGVVQLLHVGVGEGLLRGEALVGVELQQLVQHVVRLRRRLREPIRPLAVCGFGKHGAVGEEALRLLSDVVLVRLGWVSDDGDDLLEHLDVVLAGKERAAAHELRHHAPDRPHVDGVSVHLVPQQQLRRAVPPCDDVASHERLVAVGEASEAEVAHFEVAVGVDEEVVGLEVAVHHRRRVDELEPAQHLVDEVPHMIVGQLLR